MEPRLDKARHVKYWTRCLKTLLPHQYTSNDSNRMYLAFLIVSALDLLGALENVSTDAERGDYIDWIYHCQHPDGGFRMWPGTDLGEHRNETNVKWDPANIPATYFALASLLILGDDFRRVKRRRTLQWLREMQRPDGSFGETIVEGQIEGGRDPRFGYCAAGVRYILRGDRSGPLTNDGYEVHDIDVDTFIHCIRAAESFDGGLADEPLHEPHAGYMFCCLGALSFVHRLNTVEHSLHDSKHGPSTPQDVVRWLVHRQTEMCEPEAALDSEFAGLSLTAKGNDVMSRQPDTSTLPLHQSPDKSILDPLSLDLGTNCAGMNGRPNKVADTCYAWWVGASLHMLGSAMLYDQKAVRCYLLEKTQHPVLGGFGKFPGDLPDLYHSCLGLAALSLAGSTDVKQLHPGMCISREAQSRLDGLWEGWEREDR